MPGSVGGSLSTAIALSRHLRSSAPKALEAFLESGSPGKEALPDETEKASRWSRGTREAKHLTVPGTRSPNKHLSRSLRMLALGRHLPEDMAQVLGDLTHTEQYDWYLTGNGKLKESQSPFPEALSVPPGTGNTGRS